MNKDIGKFIQYARSRKPDVRIFIDSNLNVITEEQIDHIVRYGLDSLKVSCDGVTQEVYSGYRVGGNIDDVMNNVGKIIEKKKELASDRPLLIWKYLVFRHNRHEVEIARRKAQEMGIGFEASGMRVDCGKEIFEKVEDSVKRDGQWIPDDPEYNNYSDLQKGKTICEKPWKTLTIDWNGDVVPCGAIYDCRKHSFGNLLDQGFEEIWNNESFVAARKVIAGIEDENDVICSVCKKNGYQFF